ncbi:MAG: hypothetical protein JWR17_3938 [Pseudomonas sp.]|jgi:ceramide glucosyltransferase|uniref:bacteriohopanetetrol glucosamine biosynthesis glycosyltransferase HpnI n=1 Tax=Pseudomonas sp. TaxID=306 RepID=UPI00261D3CD1|nr:bacteriohopanetetrol glucosamine biosynthesis glycosyltransferase HpnI [Pseudomonas sp.]MDB6051192.1 hypothetical protein [Pseudomonas sp.]
MVKFSLVSTCVFWLGTLLTGGAAGFAVVSLGAVWIKGFRTLRGAQPSVGEPGSPVTLLKPLHGAEPGLYENLRGCCQQAYPSYQVIFGVRDPEDPAIAVVEKLRAEFPDLLIDLVIDPRVHGTNLKVSNLLNMLPLARHSWLVLADSDISVTEDYLSRVTWPLADPSVGIVTCLYYGVPRSGFWSRMGCLFIDDWFGPSVRLAHAFGSTRFAFGSTIALRRDALLAVGGLELLRDTLADDYWLGALTRDAGLRTVLSDLWVGTDVNERGLTELWEHELRWLRTIRAIAPKGFLMSFVCFTWPVCLLGLMLAPSMFNVAIAAVAISARALRFFTVREGQRNKARWFTLALTPLRDVLLLSEWAAALAGWQVKWRGQSLHANTLPGNTNGPTHHP